jgi:ABC-2 type transport system ATP-binding protein
LAVIAHTHYALEIRGLSKSFDRPAVDGLDLAVRTGEFYARCSVRTAPARPRPCA